MGSTILADDRASEAGDILLAHSASCGGKFTQNPKARVAGGIYAFIPKYIARRIRSRVYAEGLRIPLDN